MEIRGPHQEIYNAILRVCFGYFRRRRVAFIWKTLRLTTDMSVLDVGGMAQFWGVAEGMGLPIPDVTILNIKPASERLLSNMKWIVGDGGDLPFPEQSFDMVVCNSVIEHVGSKRERIAEEILRVAPRHFVQTPCKWFPVEVHLMSPFIHWLPARVRVKLIRWCTVWGWLMHPTPAQCREIVDEIHLLTASEVRKLFPRSRVVTERFCGMPKSIYAIGDQR